MRWLWLVLLAFGCGSDDGGSSGSGGAGHSFAVADESALPTCDAAAEGWIAYVKAESALKACTGGTWTDAPIGSAIKETWDCPASLDLDSSAYEVEGIFAQASVMTNGDVFITCMSATTAPGASSDSSGNSSFAPAGTTDVLCVSLASIYFYPATGKAKWFNPLTPSSSQEVTCTKK